MQQNPAIEPLAGVVVALAFFVLVGYLAWALSGTQRLGRVLMAMATLLGALPAILYALHSLNPTVQ